MQLTKNLGLGLKLRDFIDLSPKKKTCYQVTFLKKICLNRGLLLLLFFFYLETWSPFICCP